MFGRTNAGGVAAFAVISAKYPAGSICTCSDGNIRFTAKATSVKALFFIPYAGTWIVTITDPTGENKPASETVVITKEGENVSVELSYVLWLYKNGNQCEDVTGGWAVFDINSSGSYVNFEADHIAVGQKATSGRSASVGTVNKIDVTDYNTLKIICSISGFSGGKVDIGLSDKKTSDTPEIAYMSTATATEDTPLELDISNITGEHYIKTNGGGGTQEYYEFWLE